MDEIKWPPQIDLLFWFIASTSFNLPLVLAGFSNK